MLALKFSYCLEQYQCGRFVLWHKWYNNMPTYLRQIGDKEETNAIQYNIIYHLNYHIKIDILISRYVKSSHRWNCNIIQTLTDIPNLPILTADEKHVLVVFDDLSYDEESLSTDDNRRRLKKTKYVLYKLL